MTLVEAALTPFRAPPIQPLKAFHAFRRLLADKEDTT